MKTHEPVRVSARRLSEAPAPPRSTCRPGRRLQLQVRFDRRGVHRIVVRGQRGERPSSLAAPQPPTLGRLAGPSCRRSAARPARPPGRATRSRTATALPCRPRAAPLKRTPVSLRSSKRPFGQRAVHPPCGDPATAALCPPRLLWSAARLDHFASGNKGPFSRDTVKLLVQLSSSGPQTTVQLGARSRVRRTTPLRSTGNDHFALSHNDYTLRAAE